MINNIYQINFVPEVHPLTCYLSSFSSATTHSDLVIRAKQSGVQYRVIHNASILNAVGCCGLQVSLDLLYL